MQISKKEAIVKRNIPDEMIVKFNPSYLESVLLNFLTNALRYRESKRRLEITITGFREKTAWVLQIAENGVGIDLECLVKRFSGFIKHSQRHQILVG